MHQSALTHKIIDHAHNVYVTINSIVIIKAGIHNKTFIEVRHPMELTPTFLHTIIADR